MKRTLLATWTLLAGLTAAYPAFATPSTQIWIPSTDIQPYKSLHLNFDSYVRTQTNDDGTFTAPIYDIGPTFGVLPFEKVQAEVGFDLIYSGSSADKYPLYFHAKLGTPEGSLFAGSPALAVGGYNFGLKHEVTDQNITYGLAAKTIPVLGRLSAGWYWANDDTVKKDNNGVLLSWDRTLSEISDKLWAAVDYQGGKNGLGALNLGIAWAFAKNTSVIFGYDIYNDEDYAGQNTFTVQVDINYP